MKEGFYWVYFLEEEMASIVEYKDSQYWFIGGNEGCEKLNDTTFIVSEVKKPIEL